jgi:phosphoglycolate phosphatase
MNILFDLDGTLTDPYQGITKCIVYALAKLDREAPPQKDLRWCIGPPLKSSFAKLLSTDDENLVEKALVLYRERFSTVGLFENEVYEQIPEVLKSLQENGHRLYVATAKPTVYAKQIIKHFGLQQYFVSVYGSELDGVRTDKTDLISHILQSEAIDSSETLMVGDRKYDMTGAKANGIRSVGVLWGYGTKEELETSNAQVCINHPKDLYNILD